MSYEPRVPFGQTTAGIVLIQGVVTAVVSAVVTSAINNSADLPWLTIAGLFTGIGLVVFLLTSLLRRRLRSLMWGWLPRFVKWASGLRITTTRQRDEVRKSAYKEGAALITDKTKPLLSSTFAERKQLKEKLEQALSDGAKSELGKQTAESLAAEWRSKFDSIQQDLRDIDQGKDNAPTLPPPEPRWYLEMINDQGDILTYRITNLMPDSVALNVRMETVKGGFHFGDPAFWKDLSGKASGVFKGETTSGAEIFGFAFQLEWLGHDQKPRTKAFHFGPPGAD